MIDNEKINSMNSNELAVYYIKRLEEKERQDRMITETNKELAILNSILYTKFEEDGVEETKIDGIKFKLVEDESFALENPYNKKTNSDGDVWDDPNGKFYNWLKENNEAGLIVTKSSVNANTRTAFFKSRRNDKKLLPEFVKVNFWKHVKYSKAEIERRVDNDEL